MRYFRLKLRGWCLAWVIGSLLTLLLAACVPQDEFEDEFLLDPTPVPTVTPTSLRGTGGVLRIIYWQAPTTLNPHLSSAVKDWQVSRLTLEPLATFDKDGKMVPILAESIPSVENGDLSPAGEWVIWRLRQDIRWSDGQPFTAADVKFTYDFVTNPEVKSTSANSYDVIAAVEAVDAYTVRITFKEPTPVWTVPFVGVQSVLPKHVFERYALAEIANAPANTTAMVGTGPYRVVAFRDQDVLLIGDDVVATKKIIFEPNPYYRDPDKPYFSRVEIKGGGDTLRAAKAVLQEGVVDFAWNLNLDAATLLQLQTNGQGRTVSVLGPNVERLAINRSDPNTPTASGERSNKDIPHPFFSDIKVRQAFAMAIDREAIARMYLGSEVTSNLLVAPGIYASTNTTYTYDLRKAAQLLDEAGWRVNPETEVRAKAGVPMRVVLFAGENPVRRSTLEIYQAALISIGVDAQLKFVDTSIFASSDPKETNSWRHFYYDVELFFHGNQNPDPAGYLRWWTCDRIPQQANNWNPSYFNFERWCNPEYDALYVQSTKEMDPSKRREIFIQMNDLLINDIVMIPLVHRAQIAGVSNTLTGVDLTPWDSDLWNIQDWQRVQTP